MDAGPFIVLAFGCFFAWCAISMLRNGCYIGRNHRMRSGTKKYYRAGHPISFWFLVISGFFLAGVLILISLLHLTGIRVIGK